MLCYVSVIYVTTLTNLGLHGNFTVQRAQRSSSLPELINYICLELMLCTGTIKLQEKKASLNCLNKDESTESSKM